MKDHTVACETRIFPGKGTCTCGAVEESFADTSNASVIDAIQTKPEPAKAKATKAKATKAEPTPPVASNYRSDTVLEITTAGGMPKVVIVNGKVFLPEE